MKDMYIVRIHVNNVTSQLQFDQGFDEGLRKYLIELLMRELSFKPKGFQYTTAYRNGQWDGYIYLLNPKFLTFPTGLLTRVTTTLQTAGCHVDLNDLRERPVPQEVAIERAQHLTLHGITLRDYQRQAIIDAIIHERGLISMGTGGGKTEVAAGIIAALQVRTLFIVHLKTLLTQTTNRLSDRLGEPVATLGGGTYQLGEITVASIQTLHRHLQALKPYLATVKLVIVDEAHHVSNNSYLDVLKATQAYYRFGLSGTPLDRSDGSSLITIGMLGEVIHHTSSSDLITRNLLTRPTIVFIPIKKHLAFPEGENLIDWREIYEQGIVYNHYRNTVIAHVVKTLLAKGKRHILIIVKEVAHGEELQRVLAEHNITAPLLWSNTGTTTIQETVAKFRHGVIPVIISSPIFDEGIDIPEIDAMVMAGGGESTIKTIQRIGRGVRKSTSKQELLVVDFMDEHHYVLERHSKSRIRACRREKEFQVITEGGERRNERRGSVPETVR
ncbi:MAG: DEAD/DEAH box helicase [Candidatus Caldatribacterium sp.]|nr:DEAD/DEAH box helicase [Candidatus Caldatribacterium sp.]